MDKENYNKSLTKTDSDFEDSCSAKQIRSHSIHHVITCEEWDDGIGVLILLNKIKEVTHLKKQSSNEIKETYLDSLNRHQYPFENFPYIVFEIDSDENVRKNYGGSYINQLR